MRFNFLLPLLVLSPSLLTGVSSSTLDDFQLPCTTLAVTPSATVDHVTLVTHNADCGDCDFRITKTPPMDWEVPSMRPVYRYRRQYPRLVAEERGPTWQPSNLESSYASKYASSTYMESQLVGYLPQVSHTHGLIESLFGIMNDQQVSIGESTCAGHVFASNPGLPRPCPSCPGPLLDLGAVTLIALERCSTARCTVELIGDLVVEHGYYAAAPEEGQRGEAITIADGREVWMMHLLPDDTGNSALWVAQRVPEGHATACANSFVIRGIDKGSPDFLYSDNLWEVAERNGIAVYNTPRAPNGQLDWAETFGPVKFIEGVFLKKPRYCTDRIWRIWSILNPSGNWKRETDFFGKLRAQSLRRSNRVFNALSCYQFFVAVLKQHVHRRAPSVLTSNLPLLPPFTPAAPQAPTFRSA